MPIEHTSDGVAVLVTAKAIDATIEEFTPAVLAALTPDVADSWWARIHREGYQLRRVVGALLYWELRERPNSYTTREDEAKALLGVTTRTLQRWRAEAQEHWKLGPPDERTASQQRAGRAIKARNAKPQVEVLASPRRKEPEQGKRETAPIDATAHLAVPMNGNQAPVAVQSPAARRPLPGTVPTAYVDAVERYARAKGWTVDALLELLIERAGILTETKVKRDRPARDDDVKPRLKGMR